MGNFWTAVTSGNTSEETDTTSQLDKTRDRRWDTLSTQEWVQLGRLAQRPSTLLDGLLALQAMAGSRSHRNIDECLAWASSWTGKKKPKWTTLIIIDSQAVKNTCNASVDSKGYCFYKSTNGIKRHLAIDTLGFPFFTHCTRANVSDDAGLIEMLTLNIDYFKSKPVNIPKITILLDHGYHPEHLTEELEKVYPQIMTKIKFELSTKPSKQEKAEQGKSGFVPAIARWVIERSNAWMERCKILVKNFERTLSNATTKINLCFVRLMVKRLAAPS
jgi:Transposase DDE domain